MIQKLKCNERENINEKYQTHSAKRTQQFQIATLYPKQTQKEKNKAKKKWTHGIEEKECEINAFTKTLKKKISISWKVATKNKIRLTKRITITTNWKDKGQKLK